MKSTHPFTFEVFWEHRVRYRECDPMGIVYHTHYLDYFEVARTEAFRALGYSYKEMEDGGVFMPVVDVSVKYRSPARYDDLLSIKTIMNFAEPRTRIRFDYEVRRKNEPLLLVSGHVTLCFLDKVRGRPIKAPEEITNLVKHIQNLQIV